VVRLLKVRITVSSDCDLCGLCVRYCPTDVFSIVGGKLEVRSERCIYCKGCEPLCPKKAIKVQLLDEGLRIEVHKALI